LPKPAALVLAGSRGGVDPVAEYAGVSHKGLIELRGVTLIARVLDALHGAGVTRIGVSTNDRAVCDAVEGRAETLAASDGPSLSVRNGADHMGTPLLVTTSDHALLQADWVTQFLHDAPSDCDIAILLAPEHLVQAAAPATKRTYLAFADGRFSGCNLFLLRNDNALRAIDFWRRVEGLRKQPWRIALLIGPSFLLAYLAKRMTLAETVARLGIKAGVKAAVVVSDYGLAAVDVDKPSDLDLVRTLV
jgi:2-phospho-L-lactate guanylyltransferase (CobY/MobA/RfbA family)